MLGGSGANRTLQITPAPEVFGNATTHDPRRRSWRPGCAAGRPRDRQRRVRVVHDDGERHVRSRRERRSARAQRLHLHAGRGRQAGRVRHAAAVSLMRRLLSLALLAAAVFGMDAEAAVRVYRPADPSQVDTATRQRDGRTQLAQLRAQSAAPDDREASIHYVDALIAAGARSGNERYYGYAEQVLRARRTQPIRRWLCAALGSCSTSMNSGGRASARRNAQGQRS